MSAAISSPTDLDGPPSGPGSHDDSRVAGTPVVVRRNAGLAALVGAGASAIAIAYLWRATQTAAPLDWVLCGVLAVIATYYLATFVDARTPLLVADDLGVRIRLGNQWRGLPWDAVDKVEVQPRRSLVRDGRLMFAPHSLSRALDGLDARGRRAAALNQKVYGAALAVPMGLTTRVSAHGRVLADELAALAGGRADVVLVEPAVAEASEPDAPVEASDAAEPDRVVQPAAWAVQPVGEPADPVETHAEPVDRSAEPVEEPVGPVGPVGPVPWSAEPVDRSAEPVGWDPGAGSEAVAADVETAETGDETVDETVDQTVDGSDRDTTEPGTDEHPAQRAPRRSLLGGIGTVVSRVAKGRSHDVDADRTVRESPAHDRDDEPEAITEHDVTGSAARAAAPLRKTRHALRAQVTRETPATQLGNPPLLPDRAGPGRASDDEGDAAPRPDSGRVRPISQLGDPVGPLVIDDFVTEPAYDPVIGPELAAARTRVGLTVDELAERTRIRPHVIESIEVDDFAPCGGDFYARGHLRTLARVLGRDPAPLLEQYESRYATAPINARRVFEAELATGMTGSVRSTVGGPNWALLIGVVLALVMTWGVIRLFATEPPELLQNPAPALNGSAGVAGDGTTGSKAGAAPAPTPKPIRVTLVGAQDASEVVVRDRSHEIVWAGEIVLGEKRTIRATPPVRVRATNAGALEVSVNGRDRGPLGEVSTSGTSGASGASGSTVTRTFTRHAR